MSSLASHRWEQSLRALEADFEKSLKVLEDDFKRLVQALDLIVQLDRSIFQTTFDLDVLLEEMLKGLVNLVDAEYAQILLRRGSELVIVHSTNPDDKNKRVRKDECVCGLAVDERKTISSGNVQVSYPGRYQWILGREQGKEMVSEVAVPIYAPALDDNPTSEPIVVGVINIESPNADAFFDTGKIELVEKFALQAGAAINNARIHTGLSLTLKLAESIQSRAQLPDVALRDTLKQLCTLFQEGVIVQFLIYEGASDTLIIQSSTVEGTEGKSVLVGDSFSGLVIQKESAVRSNNVRRDYAKLFKDTVSDADAGRPPTQSELAVPIKDDGRIIGVLNVESPEKDAFSKYDEYMLNVVASNANVWTRIYKSKSMLALEKMETVGNVAGHLFHALNNGLFPLEWIADKLEEISSKVGPPARPELAAQIKELRSIAPSITDSLNKIQDMYAREKVLHEGVNVNEIARQVVEDIITRKSIRINWELDADMPLLRISAGIYYVFWNLLSNAQAAIKDAGEITIGTRVVRGKYTNQIEALELYVKDNGEGIPEDKRKQILQLDYSSKEGRKGGYGLWWVNTFVERWEGKMEVGGEVGKGTQVWIWLPWRPEGVAVSLTEEEKG
jgi:signal transduction histidine kinase